MKKILLVTALGLSSAIAGTTIQAADNKVEQNIGFGGGLIIGALAGGPVGAIIGAVSGVLLGKQVNEAEKVDVGSVIQGLIDAKPSDDNEDQGRFVQLMRGLAFSDDPKATAFRRGISD